MGDDHMYLEAIDPPRDSPPRRWRCRHCGSEGLMADLRRTDCVASRPVTDAELLNAILGEDDNDHG